MGTKIAEQLLNIKAVSLQPNEPFTWSSGIKSPIYCDNRLTLGYPDLRKDIAKGIQKLIVTHYPETELIAGTATAGIPHAALVSDLMDLPMCYVRSKRKVHGKGNQLEGAYRHGQKAVVVEDLISTGGSSLQAALALQEAGLTVLGIVSIFTYEFQEAKQSIEKHGFSYQSLVTFTDLIEVAQTKDFISKQDAKFVLQWKDNPHIGINLI